jgi:hypothetical protein
VVQAVVQIHGVFAERPEAADCHLAFALSGRRNGSPVAVILAVEDFDSLLETLEILSDRSAVADIREAEQQMAQGLIFSQEQVRAAVTNRRLP